jgi:hypothetical protein
VFVSSHFRLGGSERFPAKRGRSCGSVLPITRDHMDGRHTAIFKTARPHPNRSGSHKV